MWDVLTRWGFDPARFRFALRTSVAASVALVLAWALGLVHPQWAAMSVWIAAQPLRGQVVEKSLFRILGTLAGTAVGIALIQISQVHPVFLVIGLAAWVAFCTGVGNVLRGFVAYGTVLAGYTAGMVSLLDVGQSGNVLSLGLDRFGTVLLGVSVATIVGLIFSRRETSAAQETRLRVQVLVADVLDRHVEPAELMARIAQVDDDLDPQSAGQLRAKATVRATRAVLIALVPLALSGAALPQAVQEAARRLRLGDVSGAVGHLSTIPSLETLAQRLSDWAGGTSVRRVPVHRDWIGAGESTLRAGGAMLVFGLIWQATGWSAGNFMLLGLSVMISLFSTFDDPARMMRWVVWGQACGVIGMLICRWLVWPHAAQDWHLVVMMVPFIIFGSLLVGHRKTSLISFDYNMAFLLLLQPAWPVHGTPVGSVVVGCAALSGPVAAWVLYKTVFPITLKRRIDTLMRMIRRDLADLARDQGAIAHREIWRARLYHRILRLVRMSQRYGRAQQEAVSQATAALEIAQVIVALHRINAQSGLSDSQRRAVRYVLARAARIEAHPGEADRALHRAKGQLDQGFWRAQPSI